MSILRILGIIIAGALILVSFYRLRSYAEKRTDVLMLIIFGLTLLLISLFPDVINFPAELLSLRNRPKGRIITLLLISNGFLWLLFIYERFKAEQRHLQFDGLVRRLTIKEFMERHERDIFSDAIFVLMPAYNEAANLKTVLPRIPKTIHNKRIIVMIVDDGSSDETSIFAQTSEALVATHPINRGGGASLKTGYDIARLIKPLIIVTMDADGQHSPEEINSLVEPILNDEADFVIGSRILGSSAKYSRIRYYGVYIFSKLINIIIGTRITDCSSGFRAFNRSIIENCFLIQEQYHTAELIIEASKRGFRIQEKPVTINRRLSGKSKKGNEIKYGLSFLRTILKTWLR